MSRKFKWLTGDPTNEMEVAAELAGYIKLEALLTNIGATDGLSEENQEKHFKRDFPLGEGNGVLLEYREDGTFGYHAPHEESWEDEDVMGNGPLYPGFVPSFTVREIVGEAVRDKIAEERAEKYAAHYRRRALLEGAADALALVWNELRGAIENHPDDSKEVSIEWAREPIQAWRKAQQDYEQIEQMTDEEVMAIPVLP